MSATEATIRIKLGQIEVEYKGDASFLKKDLLETVKQLNELQKEHPAAAQSRDDAGSIRDASSRPSGAARKLEHSTDTIATILDAKSGPDLVFAAAAHLHFVKGKDKFTRAEILAEMRTATGHFKETFNNNLTKSLTRLTGTERLRLVATDTYALPKGERQSLEAALAETE